MRILNAPLNPNVIAESEAITAWRAMASDTIGYIADFNNHRTSLDSLPKELCESESIPDLIRIVFRMYSMENSPYGQVNFFLRNIPVEVGF
jgi:hypothetical protein